MRIANYCLIALFLFVPTSVSAQLVTGGATAAKQDTGNTSLASIDGKLTSGVTVNVHNVTNAGTFMTQAVQSGTWNIGTLTTLTGITNPVAVTGTFWQATQPVSGTFWQATQPISAASLPLPANAATDAKQDTGNASVASIDGKIIAVNTGAVVVSSSALPALAATSTKQSDGSQLTQVVDGSGNVIGATSNALDINIKSGNPSSVAVTNTGTFATQSAITAASGSIGSGAIASGAVSSGAYAAGSVADGAIVTLGAKTDAKSTATDGTAVSVMSVLKEISAMAQAPAALAAGSAVIGHVITDTTSTTAVTQATGTNLHAVIDSGSTTAVTGNVTAVQTTGTNLHTVLDAQSNYVSIAGQESVAAPTAAVWYLRKQWALPANGHFTPTHAWAAITTALTKTLIGVANNLGNLNVGTNTFTAANTVASPFHYARLFGCVTTILSATADTITPTYTDELGNSQAATGVAFASASPVGNYYEFPLASGVPASAIDSGVRAVTAATDSAATTGVVTFYGVNPLADFAGTGANQTETQSFPSMQPELNANEQIVILMMQAATTAQLKTYGVAGSLR